MWKKFVKLIKKSNYNPLIISFKVAKFLIRKSFYTIMAGVLFLIVTIIWPFQKIKFCAMSFHRIGHLAANTELFLRRLRSGYYKLDCLYIGCNASGKNPANRQLLNMFKRNFAIIENKFFGETIFSFPIRKSKFYDEMPFNSNEYYEFNNLPPTLFFTLEEEEKGRQELEKMGIGPDDWFVCFHARDGTYLNETEKGVDWSYHDYRDCNIENYLPTMEYITKKGGYAIRMGYIVAKTLNAKGNPKIIDYATRFRSDFMDIYLSTHCKFFVGCTAGLRCVPAMFGIPVVGTNFIPLELPPYRKEDLFLPKKIRNVKEDRLLTFREIFDRRIGIWLNGHDFTKAGLEVIENTPEEILGIVKEMNESLDGQFQYTQEDKELQSRYHSLIKPCHRCYKTPAKIGTFFLRENKYLL
ncbi:MAG: hypothetical protein C0412_09820 [Flavobacterium sp.]|nr:hypothetical protein [Flavobacterium sp.]